MAEGYATKSQVGVIGAGSFGTAISNLLAHKKDVLLFSRQEALVQKINSTHRHFDIALSPRIRATNDLAELAANCDLLFPIVPSEQFRAMMKQLGPYLKPYHVLIHGTKGFDLQRKPGETESTPLNRSHIHTMSEVIRQESVVVRIGCLSGPNLAGEIMEGQPTATLIASHFQEVINLGKDALSSSHFQVFGSREILGAELAGALKNSIAIGSGILAGMGLGKNIQALLITRGLMEMISFGKAMGATPAAFLGTAGIGDLICTATSEKSRNFTFGNRLGKGEKADVIKDSMPELAEGLRTLRIARDLAEYYQLHVPITEVLYRVVHEEYPFERAIELLMKYPYYVDVDFL
ncbi:MAG: NAD(P)-dependent glycerol-3-phosphate dehydrogenase [Saprospiraceae bacterium]|nr:NAD(P)-dependent glycerol-3-phosphate dehydrogenase [Saprospiraceae bacterium]